MPKFSDSAGFKSLIAADAIETVTKNHTSEHRKKEKAEKEKTAKQKYLESIKSRRNDIPKEVMDKMWAAPTKGAAQKLLAEHLQRTGA